MSARRRETETHRSFAALLDRQYALVEGYANALTGLRNASSSSSSVAAEEGSNSGSGRTRIAPFGGDGGPEGAGSDPIDAALDALDRAKRDLRTNFEALSGHEAVAVSGRPQRGGGKIPSEMCSDHLALSKRVVDALFENVSWHSNGVIDDVGKPTDEILETGTVAMATLNASVARIKTTLGGVAE